MTTEPPQSALAVLRVAFDAVLATPIYNDLLHTCFDAGWTPALVKQVHDWAVAAVAQRTGIYLECLEYLDDQGLPTPEPFDPIQQERIDHEAVPAVTSRLIRIITVMVLSKWTLTGACQWARVSAACPTEGVLDQCQDAGRFFGDPAMPLADLAGLLWAADMGTEEAVALHEEGRLEVRSLEMLAGLRGFALGAEAVLRS